MNSSEMTTALLFVGFDRTADGRVSPSVVDGFDATLGGIDEFAAAPALGWKGLLCPSVEEDLADSLVWRLGILAVILDMRHLPSSRTANWIPSEHGSGAGARLLASPLPSDVGVALALVLVLARKRWQY